MIALYVLALAMPQAAAPSFDCARASTPVERSICADRRLAAQDRQVADAYARVRRSLSPAARDALARDQRWYLGARDEWFENRDRWDGFPDLSSRMTSRVAFLTSLSTMRPDTLVGRWRNVAGEVEITRMAGGRLSVAATAAQPTNARWLCEEVGFEGVPTGQSVEGMTSDDPAYRIRATLKDGYLEVEEEALTSGSYGARPIAGQTAISAASISTSDRRKARIAPGLSFRRQAQEPPRAAPLTAVVSPGRAGRCPRCARP